MRLLSVAALGLAAGMLSASPALADVTLTIANGRVTLVAKDATVRQILAEWARVGQTKIVNLERIPGGPVSVELDNVPEAQALDVLLRSVAGYVAAPRPVDAANLSHFDRVMVMPMSVAPRPVASAAPPPPAFAPPPFAPPAGQQAPGEGGDDDQTNMPQVGPNRGPIFNTPQQPQMVYPQVGPNGLPLDPNGGARGAGPRGPAAPPVSAPPMASPAPGVFPRAPSAPSGSGVAVPGMIVQPPQPAPGTQPATGRGGSGE